MRSKEEIMHRLPKHIEKREKILKQYEEEVKQEESDTTRFYGRQIADLTFKIKELEWVLNNKK